MSEIRNLSPEALWRNFDELTKVPRPSGHMEKNSSILARLCKESWSRGIC